MYDESTLAIGLARIGQPSQRVVAGPLWELRRVDFGGPLHSLVIVGEMHAMEAELVKAFMVKPADLVAGESAAAAAPGAAATAAAAAGGGGAAE